MPDDICPLEAMLDVASEAMIIRDANGRITAWNEAATRLYGYQRSHALGACVDSLLHTNPPLQFPQRAAPAVWNACVERRTSDAEAVLVEARLSAVYGSDGRLAHILEASRKAEGDGSEARVREQFRAMFREMPIALCSVNSDQIGPYYASLGINDRVDFEKIFIENPEIVQRVAELNFFEEVNPKCVEILGAKSASDLIGRPVAFAFAKRPDSYRKIMVAGLLTEKVEQETQLVGLDGVARDVLLTCIRYQDGRRRSTLAGIIDIGPRLKAEAERHRISDQYARASRTSFLGEAFGMFAHEMSQPISAIATGGQSGLRWLAKTPPDIASARACLELSVSQAMRAGDIINRVRQFGDTGEVVFAPASVPHMVQEAVRIVESRAKSQRIVLELRDSTSPHEVRVDQFRIEQAIANILLNAIEAIATSGATDRRIQIEMMDAEGSVVCIIADSGKGFEAGQIDDIFKRSIAKSSQQQTFGLPNCKAIFEFHDGHILASNDSALGGAKLQFALPATFLDSGPFTYTL